MSTAALERPAPTRPQHSAPKAEPKPVQLEVNRTGIWRLVLEFDAGDDVAYGLVREGVEALGMADGSAAFRIVTKGFGVTLLNYSNHYGWTPGK